MIRYGMRAVSIVALVFTLCVVPSTFVVAGERCTYGAQECLDHIVEKYRKRGWMGVEIEMSEETGITIIHVHGKAPAAKAGLRVGDVLLEVDGVPLSAETLKKDKSIDEKMAPGNTIVLTVGRGVKTFKTEIKLIETPDFIVALYVGRHMIAHADFYSDGHEKHQK